MALSTATFAWYTTGLTSVSATSIQATAADAADGAIRIRAKTGTDTYGEWGNTAALTATGNTDLDPMAPSDNKFLTFKTKTINPATGDAVDGTDPTPATYEFQVGETTGQAVSVNFEVTGKASGSKICWVIMSGQTVVLNSSCNNAEGTVIDATSTSLAITAGGTVDVAIKIWYDGPTMVNSDDGMEDNLTITVSIA